MHGMPCRYSSDKAGQYELAVKSSLDGEPLAGSPFSLTVTPGELSPSALHSAAGTLRGLPDSRQPGPYLHTGQGSLWQQCKTPQMPNFLSKPFLLCQTCLALLSFSYVCICWQSDL